MYLTQHTDYGLRVLVYTAINDDTLVNIGTIAETYNISKSHLMKVVTSLVKGGFLVSVRGKGGGLRLADNPDHPILPTDRYHHRRHQSLLQSFRSILTARSAGQADLRHTLYTAHPNQRNTRNGRLNLQAV